MFRMSGEWASIVRRQIGAVRVRRTLRALDPGFRRDDGPRERCLVPLIYLSFRPELIGQTSESKKVSQSNPPRSRWAYSPPHPVRTDEVDGERRVNRTAG